MISDGKLRKIAELKLQLAVLNGEKWALEAVLGISKTVKLDFDSTIERKWKVEVFHTGNVPHKEGVNDGEEEKEDESLQLLDEQED